ncbi:MAG TPA: FAD-dependent oxidoreductase, partial [Nakamurella sp.]
MSVQASALSPQARAKALTDMAEQQFDVLVIGAGVVGAGAALDAASRGLSVALVEARDLAAGTSSRSSKLVHGGLRYLKQLNFSLVFEALRER